MGGGGADFMVVRGRSACGPPSAGTGQAPRRRRPVVAGSARPGITGSGPAAVDPGAAGRRLGTEDGRSDGIEALTVLRQGAPDLVLSDIMMPRLDGYALMRQVREDPALRSLPMIAVSASFPGADQPSAEHPAM